MRRFGVIFNHRDIVLPPLYPTSGHLGKHSYKLKKVVRRCRDYRSKSSFSILVKAIPKMRGCYCMIMHQCMFINKKKKLDDIKLRPFDVLLCQIRIIHDDFYSWHLWFSNPKRFMHFHSAWKSLKISDLNFWILAFSTNFWPIKKLTCLVTLFDRKF